MKPLDCIEMKRDLLIDGKLYCAIHLKKGDGSIWQVYDDSITEIVTDPEICHVALTMAGVTPKLIRAAGVPVKP